MPRTRNGPHQETELVSFRLEPGLLARIDQRARVLGGTRTDGTRDLLERGLASLEDQGAAPVPETNVNVLRHPPKETTASPTQAECVWCGRPRNGPHYEKCPHNPSSGLNRFFRELGYTDDFFESLPKP